MGETSGTTLNDMTNKPGGVENNENSLVMPNPSQVRPSEVSSFASVEEIIRDMAYIFDFLKPLLVLKNDAYGQTTHTFCGGRLSEISPRASNRDSLASDFHKLQEDFSKICCDYTECLELQKVSKALEFCSKIIYEVGPQSRRQQGSEKWIFRFPNKSENQPQVNTAFVINSKKEGIYYEPLKNNYTIILSVKQAGVLAMHTFCKLIDLTSPTYLLTPLAASVFTKNDIDKIAQELKITTQEVLKAVNCSCQDGGEYLEASELYIAAVASIPGLKKLKNQKARDAILRRLLNRYTAMKKKWDLEKFKIYAVNSFCMQMPDIEELIAMFNEAQLGVAEA